MKHVILILVLLFAVFAPNSIHSQPNIGGVGNIIEKKFYSDMTVGFDENDFNYNSINKQALRSKKARQSIQLGLMSEYNKWSSSK